GEGITEVDPYLRLSQISSMELASDINSAFTQNLESKEILSSIASKSDNFPTTENVSSGGIAVDADNNEGKPQSGGVSRETLGLLLSCQLAELHGGDITIQGSSESGYRYVLSLPLDKGSTEAVADA
ncbi:MAG: ATP-binding protein, partial [Rivularia sp. ALOHA_DT_140]|nr:ATP-binding protein [Rivularia sp. ALOHA_DT_140]